MVSYACNVHKDKSNNKYTLLQKSKIAREVQGKLVFRHNSIDNARKLSKQIFLDRKHFSPQFNST